MQRPLLAAVLAAWIAVSGAGLVAAGEPTASPQPLPSAEPSPSPDPTPTPSTEPTPGPSEPTSSPAPTDVPVASPPTGPSSEPAASDGPPADAPAPAAEPLPSGAPDPAGRYIVVLDRGTDPNVLIRRHAQRNGVRATARFDASFPGYAARLDADQRRDLLSDPSVAAVVPDELIELTAQTTPTGVSRVGARSSSVAAINGTDQRVDSDIAIVDTGIAPHPDLNVVGGVNCTSNDRTDWYDYQGHGTHVAGTVAALDNDFGVVGVAPGARLWAVRILNSSGYGLLSWYVCGLDWILAQRDPSDAGRPLIEGVNMSVAKTGSDDQNCGYSNTDVLHQAICRLVSGGITVVAAAANERTSASKYVPAAYNEVITVSALADTDGAPGGLGGTRCYSWGSYDVDDTFADFSNYGSDVDIIAPGKCIWSTKPGNTYAYSSGTSMAAPAVTGAVALYKASRPDATPAEVRESLRYLGNMGWDTSSDPDSYPEPLLDVSRIGNLGIFRTEITATPPLVTEKGRTFSLPVSILRSSTYFERVRLAATEVPAGWTVKVAGASVYGWNGTGTTVSVTVPAWTEPGDYTFTVIGRNWARTVSSTVTVRVESMPFRDVDAYEGSIRWLFLEGITAGCSETRFCPDDRVSRAQMAMFLVRALDLPASSTDYFDDDRGVTGESSINALRKAGITSGCGVRRFCPTDDVTRAQMAQFLTRALGLPATSTDYFDDDDGVTGESSINALAAAGLTNGCGPRRYCPSEPISREQMAALLYRALNR
ncbi:MAG: S8 family serine peptidase [Candidatus Limnocylindria bacterium]